MHIINIFEYNLKSPTASPIVVKTNALKPKLEKIIPVIKPFLFGKYFQQFFKD